TAISEPVAALRETVRHAEENCAQHVQTDLGAQIKVADSDELAGTQTSLKAARDPIDDRHDRSSRSWWKGRQTLDDDCRDCLPNQLA
ncbi:MAG: hypothetical protein ACJA0V_001740, partial [Planctomycetota bacterium]